MKKLIYIILFCAYALQAQQQKYILLDSITSHYKVKQYTLDTSPYGFKSTIEMYNVFDDDFLILISVLPDFQNLTKWEEIDIQQVQNNLLPTKELFSKIRLRMLTSNPKDVIKVRLVKKEKGKYYAATRCLTESYYCRDFPREMQIATSDFIINTNQPITSVAQLKLAYKQVNGEACPLERENADGSVQEYLKHIYLLNVEEKKGNTAYYFYKFADYFEKGVGSFVYIKGKGIVAGAYYNCFVRRGKHSPPLGSREKLTLKNIPESEELLLAEELK